MFLEQEFQNPYIQSTVQDIATRLAELDTVFDDAIREQLDRNLRADDSLRCALVTLVGERPDRHDHLYAMMLAAIEQEFRRLCPYPRERFPTTLSPQHAQLTQSYFRAMWRGGNPRDLQYRRQQITEFWHSMYNIGLDETGNEAKAKELADEAKKVLCAALLAALKTGKSLVLDMAEPLPLEITMGEGDGTVH